MDSKPRLNNPPAFPNEVTRGMTLRDYFAGQVLVGMGTWAPDLSYGGTRATLDNVRVVEARAKWAYAQADAMLKERDNG